MLKFEKKVADLFEKNILIIALITALITSLLLRISMFSFVSSDMEGYLLGWFGQIEQLGKIKALNTQVGNYSVLYQTLIAIMTYIPINPIYQYKLLSVFFDYSLALAIGLFVYEIKKDRFSFVIAVIVSLFVPIVFVNSALWGQCDAIYSSFAVWSLYAFSKKKYPLSFILFGLACSFKLQAVFLLPFFLFAYIRKKEFSLLNFFIIPAVMEAVCIPAMIMGRGFKAAFSTFYYQTGSCDKMYFNYPSLWSLFSDLSNTDFSRLYIGSFKIAAIILTFMILAVVMTVLFCKKISLNSENMIYISFIFVYTCVLFLPGMHERYGFLFEMLALIICFINKKMIPAEALLIMISCVTYGSSLFEQHTISPFLAILNVSIYIYCLFVFFSQKSLSECDCSEVSNEK